jgi:hypothetical protein
MTRRRLTIALHWAAFLLLILLLAGGGAVPLLGWAFALAGLTMVLLALVFGLLNGPGPKLEGTLRAAHPWLSRLMYALLAWAALATLTGELGHPLPGPRLPAIWFTVLAAASLHGVFHLWRHTALGDGALRRITPHMLHGIL